MGFGRSKKYRAPLFKKPANLPHLVMCVPAGESVELQTAGGTCYILNHGEQRMKIGIAAPAEVKILRDRIARRPAA